jgi:hypothetical protein
VSACYERLSRLRLTVVVVLLVAKTKSGMKDRFFVLKPEIIAHGTNGLFFVLRIGEKRFVELVEINVLVVGVVLFVVVSRNAAAIIAKFRTTRE